MDVPHSSRDDIVLEGRDVRLEPLAERHAEGLAAAAAAALDPSLYQWTFVPQGHAATLAYIQAARAARAAGTAVPFATVRRSDGAILGSTRFAALERWEWPAGHGRHGGGTPDVCEIGYTWLSAAALRTAANTEAKLLMLTHAFEVWDVLRVCLKTDVRNTRSRAAIERLGGRLDGILRAHMLGAGGTVRDSAWYSILASEWPAVRQQLHARLHGPLNS